MAIVLGNPYIFLARFIQLMHMSVYENFCISVRPKSIGQIKLSNKYPDSAPLINPNYLEHPDDVQALVEGININ